VLKRLEEQGGSHLVFVRYNGVSPFEEWVYNPADLDSARVLFVHDLGAAKNAQLLRTYPNRTAWLVNVSNQQRLPSTQPPLQSDFGPYDGE
jgi:hypothetical protein